MNESKDWKGFNLLEKYSANDNEWDNRFSEHDFALMADWGFNFVRIPCSYLCWMNQHDWMESFPPKISKPIAISHIDEALQFGKSYAIHISLSLHRIQGYCVNPPAEPLDLWTNEKALKIATWQWCYFAERYRGVSNQFLSFDLINEPANVSEENYSHVIKTLVSAIREIDPNRTLIVNGLDYGKEPVHSLSNLNVIQSTRGYHPYHLTHYAAPWAEDSSNFPKPSWPYDAYNEHWDKQKLIEKAILPWQELESKNTTIHVGEWGTYRFTPHDTTLNWMRSNLELWKEANWGWALWNLKGSFGILNSMRTDVNYEKHKGYLLDKKMLELLQEFLA
jgi:endoglucanase